MQDKRRAVGESATPDGGLVGKRSDESADVERSIVETAARFVVQAVGQSEDVRVNGRAAVHGPELAIGVQ